MQKPFSFNKKEKLKSKKLLEQLFAEGKSFNVFPIKVIYRFLDEMEHEHLAQVAVGTSTKNFKRANKRNRIKRLLRENYRLNKAPLLAALQEKNKRLGIFFLYIDKEVPKYSTLNFKMPLAIERLVKDVLD